jgi:hypothetical protein
MSLSDSSSSKEIGLTSGNGMTSLIDGESVNKHDYSIPTHPKPPVGGIPYSRALMKS